MSPTPMTESGPNRQRLLSRFERLIAFNSENPPGREIETITYLAEILRGMGLGIMVDEFAPGRANVVAQFVNGAGPTFAFNSHVDVVPAGGGWSSDPFKLVNRGSLLYGRGACDAKGQVACMLEAIELLVPMREQWSGTLMGVFVADEEVASRGARAFVAAKPHVDLCVIGEPTSNAVAIAHKGSMRPMLRIKGVTAHSASPDKGTNPLYKAAELLRMIAAEHRALQSLSHPLLGSPSLTVTRMNAGHADNVTPEFCEMLLDRRMIPEEREADVRSRIEGLLARALAEHGVQAEITAYLPTTGGATETRADQPIVRAAIECSRRHGVNNRAAYGLQGACDLVHFRSIGAEGVVMGPGTLDVAHKPDEYVPEDELFAACLIHRDLVLSLLRPQ
jgi:acetylornithine deacetylase/succinyl-diaminopimelate desuccinylase-like protein